MPPAGETAMSETAKHEITAKGRLAIIAGRGSLPSHVALAARAAGEDPFVIGLKGEADSAPQGFEHAFIDLGDASALARLIRDNGIDRVVMSGGVDRRPDWREFRAPLWLLPVVPRLVRTLRGGGDDRVLRAVIELIEQAGCRVIGAHEVAPDLLAEIGPQTRKGPTQNDWRDILSGYTGADMIGRMDVGQGAVSVSGRVIALEGPEGTDKMLQRVTEMRRDGRITSRPGGVLVKLCKRQQDERADLPSIGPRTIDAVRGAGLAGIVLEAGRALVLDREQTVRSADAEGVFVLGIDRVELERELAQPR